MYILALPEREEDDGLDGEELEDWVVRTEELACCLVEHEEGVECQTDADVVDDRDVEVPTVLPVVAKIKKNTSTL